MSLQNLKRNLLLSVATTVMMGLILFIFNVIMVLNVLTESSLQELGNKVDLLIYVNDSASVFEVTEMIEDIISIPIVTEASFTSKEEALKEFINLYPDKADPFTTFGIENPLPSNVKIITESPDQHGIVIDYLQESQFAQFLLDIESSSENQEIVARLLSVTDFTKKLIIGVTVTFIFGSLLMIMNAIHLSIFTRKTEIEIMRLVGARPSMIRYPFLFEGAFYSFIAVFISLILLMIFLEGTKLSSFTSFTDSFNPLTLILVETIVSVFIGITSSYIAINYYLKHE
ncbi:FtsX-like permease family protein [Candidatus Peregrinibacteria bacterium]|nr:FtsX-like permease family protein [Candidatus Peregrinibacteria bacterium]MBT5824141.1 FtsX-like permease family protein [Candidatus Peregrinibacteria bacterium]